MENTSETFVCDNDPVKVRVSGSKSLSHRAVIAASLATGVDGKSVISNVLESVDIACTIDILRACGVEISHTGKGEYKVAGTSGLLRGGSNESPLVCNVQESGTTCRLLSAVLASGQGVFRVEGTGRMHDRPVLELVSAIERLGARVNYLAKSGYPPFLLTGTGQNTSNHENMVEVNCDESSQYLSGILMAAPIFAKGRGASTLTVSLGGQKAVSWPYVGVTLQVLRDWGLKLKVEYLNEDDVWILDNNDGASAESSLKAIPGRWRCRLQGEYLCRNYDVEGDWSGASYFLGAGAIGPAPVHVAGLKSNSLQGDRVIADILTRMGAKLEWQDGGLTVYPSVLHGQDFDMSQCPDLVPTVVALAARAQGATVLRGIGHLRIKESDRIESVIEEFSKVGCVMRSMKDESGESLVIAPATESGVDLSEKISGQLFSSHHDHRIAMSVAMLGLGGYNGINFQVQLDNPACVSKSFPEFWDLWAEVIK